MKRERNRYKFVGVFPIVVIYLILLNSLIPALNPHYSMSQTNEARWFTEASFSRHDFAAARWMAYNVPSEDLILNDLSYMSFFLPSFNINNVIKTNQECN